MHRAVNWCIRLLLSVMLISNGVFSFAQDKDYGVNTDIDLGKDTMMGSGKIYVVMAICITILLGLIVYAIRIDRKISRIEKDS